MVKATVQGVEIASTEKPILVEGNQYFPPEDINSQYFKLSAKNLHTTCGWKGEASYYDIHLDDGTVLADAAWYYPGPMKTDRAKEIQGYVAFYKTKVEVS